MTAVGRYLRLWLAFGRYSLTGELAFRGNFLAKITVELLWLGIMLFFYRTVFAKTSVVADWTEAKYLFFVGCYFALEGMIETFFLGNCLEFAELIRSGDLDFHLLRPIDEQFLISCRSIDWSTTLNVVLGFIVMGLSLVMMEWTFDPVRLLLFPILFLCGLGLAYGFLLMLSAGSVWLTRNQSLMELWWLFTTLMRYPRDIYSHSWAMPLSIVFSFVIPIMLVVHVPASTMVMVFDPWICLYTVAATAGVLALSRWWLRFALRRYRSASS
jgi:ABC-2 type transport system permease protein